MSLQCYTEFSRSPQSNMLPDKYEALTGCVLVESLDHCAVKDTWDRCYRRIQSGMDDQICKSFVELHSYGRYTRFADNH